MIEEDDLKNVGRDAPSSVSLRNAAKLLGLGDERIVEARRPSATEVGPLTIKLAGGRLIRWRHQGDMLTPRSLLLPVLSAGLGPEKPLTQREAYTVYRLLVSACQTGERTDALDEARGWVDGLLAIGQTYAPDSEDAAAVFKALVAIREYPSLAEVLRMPPPWRAPVLVLAGRQHVRRSDLAAFVRAQGVQVSYEELAARLAEVGWQTYNHQLWEPGVSRSEAPFVRLRSYCGAVKR